MTILVDDRTRVLVQGITGGEGSFHTRQMVEYGTQENITHRPAHGEDRGEMVGAYAVIHLQNGGIVQRYLEKREVLAARPSHWQKGPWGDKNPWVQAEMWMKTALKRTLKTAPLSPELNTAVVSDEMASRGASWKVRIADGELTPEITDKGTEPEVAKPPEVPDDKIPDESNLVDPAWRKPELDASTAEAADMLDGAGEEPVR